MPDTPDVGEVASTVMSSDTEDLTKIITAGSEAAGVGMEAASIAKLKTHKDNPTQIPVGKTI